MINQHIDHVLANKAYKSSPLALSSASNPSVVAAGKIVVVKKSKGIGFAVANAFGTASASQIVLVARNEAILKKAQKSLPAV